MPLKEDERNEVESLVSQLASGKLDDSQKKRFTELLHSHSDAIDLYLDHYETEAMLRETYGALTQPVSPANVPRHDTASAWQLAVAALILLAVGIGVGGWSFSQRSSDQGTISESQQKDLAASAGQPNETSELVESGCAVISKLVDAKFSNGASYQEGDVLRTGRLKLFSGAAQIDFFCGATMLMDEATEVNIVDSWEAECLQGKVTMRVPPPAIGFRLVLEGMKIVDLGTEFGVEANGTDSTLHVFDGKVEAHVQGSPMRIINEGESLKKSPSQEPIAGKALPAQFPNAERFQQRSDDYWKRHHANWWSSMQSVRSDDRIIGCYLFKQWDDKRWGRLVNNFAIPTNRSRAGSAVGTRWVEGRWPTKDAMEFKSPGDRIRMNLGDIKHDGLTMAAWLRVDGLDQKFSALMLTDGYEDGEPHWQINRSGRMIFSVSYAKQPPGEGLKSAGKRQNQIYYSPPIFSSGGRRWHHVAVTYDAMTGEAIQYFDGREVSREISEHHLSGRKITFGSCEIGNWGLPQAGVVFPIRNLNGCVDEFLIYKEPLTSQEITNLYRLGTTSR